MYCKKTAQLGEKPAAVSVELTERFSMDKNYIGEYILAASDGDIAAVVDADAAAGGVVDITEGQTVNDDVRHVFKSDGCGDLAETVDDDRARFGGTQGQGGVFVAA